ncbi:MAG: MATE family efflux transporter [Acidobacteriales bacterium]|nr:MATE family efflux transporter [Terriglobales bacterium]
MTGEASQLVEDSASALGEESVGKLLVQYSLPAVISTSVASLYNIVDRVFIGQGVGPMAISGLALTFPMMNLAAAFGALVGAGAAALVSIRLGQGRRQEAHAILGNTVFLNFVLSSAYALVCFLLLDKILYAMGASPQTLPYARQFMQIILLGNVFTHVYLGLNNVMRASGYPRKAMAMTLLTVGINVILAPLFIFVFHWGIRGAATATVLAQAIGALCEFPHFLRPDSSVRFHLSCLRPNTRIIRDIFAIGMSNFVILFCASFVSVTYNLRLAHYGGDYAIGAFGIVNSLANLAVMVTIGVNMGMQPIAGYNFGARRFSRVRKVFRLAVLAASSVTTCGFLLGELFPRMVARAFTVDGELIAQAVLGLRLTFAVYPINGFQIATSGFFQAIGRARISMLLSLSRQVLLLIPALVILPGFFGLSGVWLAGPVSDLAAALVALMLLRTQFHKSLTGTLA